MPKVSVIIPVYNVEPYLKRCLDCVVNQTLSDIEIILINDCSTDGSLAILKDYANKDKRITLIDLPENKGAGYARNQGLKVAKGEYLGFIDPDDAVDLNYYEELYKKATETNSDIVKCIRIVLEPDGSQNISKMNKNIKNKSKFEFTYEWTTAIYKASLIFENKITIPDYLVSEDIVFLNKLLIKSKRVEVIDNVKYHYYRREGSLNSKDYSANKMVDALKAIDDILSNYNIALSFGDISNEEYISQYYRYMNTILVYTVRKTDIDDLQLMCAKKYIELFKSCKLPDRLELLLKNKNPDYVDCIKYNNPQKLLQACFVKEDMNSYIIKKLKHWIRKDICGKSINNSTRV